jgi:hypothetical protein
LIPRTTGCRVSGMLGIFQNGTDYVLYSHFGQWEMAGSLWKETNVTPLLSMESDM